MYFSTTSLSLALLSLISAAPAVKRWDPKYYAGALYNANQGQDMNEILVSAIKSDGTLEYACSYPTGGKGGGQRGVDPLHAQDSVLVWGEYLFAVNALSNSISMFQIDKTE